MVSPYESPKSMQREDTHESLVTLFVASNQVEGLAVVAYLEVNEIFAVMEGMGIANALAMGPAPETAFQIKVPASQTEAAQALLERYAGSEAVDEEGLGFDTSEPEAEASLLEFRRRLKFAWIFLIIPLGPISPVISLLNSTEAMRLAKPLNQKTGLILLVITLACVELALYLLYIGLFFA